MSYVYTITKALILGQLEACLVVDVLIAIGIHLIIIIIIIELASPFLVVVRQTDSSDVVDTFGVETLRGRIDIGTAPHATMRARAHVATALAAREGAEDRHDR